MKRAKEHQGRKYGVKLWFPPEHIAEVAKNRTGGMLAYYFANCQQRDFVAIRDLVRAAYLQGLNDMADVAARAEVAKE